MTRLIGQISAIAPLDRAIDGTRKPKRIVVTRKPPPPAGSSRWRCPICGRPAKSAEDQARHVGIEASRLHRALAKSNPDEAERFVGRRAGERGLRFSAEEYDQVRQLHAEGMTRAAVARIIGRNEVAVWRIASRLGLTFDRNRKISQEDIDRVRCLHEQGLGRVEIAAEIGRSVDSVTRIASRLGLQFERHRWPATLLPRHPPVTQADYDRVKELHAQGLSRNAIAEAMGRSGRTISRIAEELGLRFEHRARTRAATDARKAEALIRQGWTPPVA